MSEFKKYSSIENTYNKEFLDKVREDYGHCEYVVQEKVHGANCCFICDGKSLQFAKRSELVEEKEKFYDHEELVRRYVDKIFNLTNQIKKSYEEVETVSVYGEMYGGRYPHPEVANDNKIMCIQKGVFYCPHHEFYGFDICIQGENLRKYLTVDETNELLHDFCICHAKTLYRGTLDECLGYPNTFISTIPTMLGYPPIEGNFCEGVVIRPTVPQYFGNGSRVLLKNKNEKFAEKKSVKKRTPKLFIETTYSEGLNDLLPLVEEYVNENRYDAVTSKIGEISYPRDVGKMMGLMSKDVLEDFLKDHRSPYALLEKSEQKIINQQVNKLVTSLIKSKLR
jgi:RNA ligase, Rnl2 family